MNRLIMAIWMLLCSLGMQAQMVPSTVVLSSPQVTFRRAANKYPVSIFQLYFEPADGTAARDIGKVLVDSLDVFRTNFGQSFQRHIAVEIYPDQSSYDEHVMEGTRRGSPASSGNLTIQMVSPRSPIRIPGLPYKTRLLMARHELAHLFVNEINLDAPNWLGEGIASFAGDADFYHAVCRLPEVTRLFESPPSIRELESSYGRVLAADVLSFTFAEYIATKKGWPTLVALARSPENIEGVLGASREEITTHWHEYIRKQYGGSVQSRR